MITLQSIAFVIAIGITSLSVSAYSERQPVVIPKVPQAPNCGNSFPGTSTWNSCWNKFREDMAKFQLRMQAYSQKMVEMANKNAASKGTSLSISSGTSSVNTNGYSIKSNGVSISTFLQNSVLQIKLNVGKYDALESKTQGNEIEMKIRSGESTKWVKIRAPDYVKISDLKLEKGSDTIMVTGPVKPGFGGGFSSTTFNSGNQGTFTSATSSFNQNAMQPPLQIFQQQGGFPFNFQDRNIGSSVYNQVPQMWFF